MSTHIVNGVKIHTSHYLGQWQAVTDDYDCDCDQDGFYSTHPCGTGRNEAEAIADLMDLLEIGGDIQPAIPEKTLDSMWTAINTGDLRALTDLLGKVS